MGKTKNPTIKRGVNHFETETVKNAGKALGKVAASEASQFNKGFWEQLMNWDFDGSQTSSESTKVSASEAPLVVKDPVTGAVEVFHRAKHHGSESAPKKVHKEKPKVQKEAKAAMDYFGEFTSSPDTEKVSRVEKQGMHDNIQAVKMELRKLVESTKTLQMEFGSVTVEQSAKDFGKYHETFFEWMLVVIRNARAKVEESGTWLQTVKGKSGRKKGTFAVSNQSQHQSGERTTIQNSAG